MPPKRKEGAATPVASGPKQKWSKTSFRTPTTAALEGTTTSPASDVGSASKNRVVTLRASASGHRGYCSQDLSTQCSSFANDSESLAEENSALPSDNIGDMAEICETIPAPDLGNDTRYPTWFKCQTKAKKKEYNNSKLHSLNMHFANENLDKT